MKLLSIRRLILAALMTALTYIATTIIKLPTPTLGYIHMGDALVLLCGLLLGPLTGGLAAGLGSMLSDLLGGYLLYAPATLVIKAGSAWITASLFGFFTQHLNQAKNPSSKVTVPKKLSHIPLLLFSGAFGELFMVIGYFSFAIFLLGLSTGDGLNATTLSAGIAAAATGVPFNAAQGVLATILAAVLYPILHPLTTRFLSE